MTDSWELAAREAIRDLLAAYTHAGDGGRFDDFCALFAPDGVLELDEGRVLRGPGALRTFLDATQRSLAAGADRPMIRHHVSSVRIAFASPEEARVTSYFLAITQRGPDHWGRYRDTCVCLDGRWCFARRRVRVDGMAPGSWAAERRAGLTRDGA